MDFKIEFPEKMPVDVRDQIVAESTEKADTVLADHNLVHQDLYNRLVKDFVDMKIKHYNRIDDANASANTTIKLHQDKIDELKLQVENLKRQIK